MPLQRLLDHIGSHAVLRSIFRGAAAHLDDLAAYLVQDDPFGENAALLDAFRRARGTTGTHDLHGWYRHQLWCTLRQFEADDAAPAPLGVHLSPASQAHLAQTAGKPTIALAPMTLAQGDATQVSSVIFNGRPFIMYGEGVLAVEGAEAAGEGPAAVRRIMATLHAGGVLCTYADFAYSSHHATRGTLFGVPRAYASGFLSMVARPGICVLPLVFIMAPDNRTCEVICNEPFMFNDAGRTLGPEARRTAVLGNLVPALEQLIVLAPQQWLLMPTLTFATPQSGA